ncbi:hypothetical protein OFN29_27115, partial [Escherichia coli]|nr:hypothetical protein [Escherichia coli]
CGGPIHSKRTGRPGWVDMWDGWFRLQDMVEAGDEVSLSGDLIKRQSLAESFLCTKNGRNKAPKQQSFKINKMVINNMKLN